LACPALPESWRWDIFRAPAATLSQSHRSWRTRGTPSGRRSPREGPTRTGDRCLKRVQIISNPGDTWQCRKKQVPDFRNVDFQNDWKCWFRLTTDNPPQGLGARHHWC
jgi:hypothetical protein